MVGFTEGKQEVLWGQMQSKAIKGHTGIGFQTNKSNAPKLSEATLDEYFTGDTALDPTALSNYERDQLLKLKRQQPQKSNYSESPRDKGDRRRDSRDRRHGDRRRDSR
eukprot:Platyproteum_vivax@DN5336_c0_g1_i1.p1